MEKKLTSSDGLNREQIIKSINEFIEKNRRKTKSLSHINYSMPCPRPSNIVKHLYKGGKRTLVLRQSSIVIYSTKVLRDAFVEMEKRGWKHAYLCGEGVHITIQNRQNYVTYLYPQQRAVFYKDLLGYHVASMEDDVNQETKNTLVHKLCTVRAKYDDGDPANPKHFGNMSWMSEQDVKLLVCKNITGI